MTLPVPTRSGAVAHTAAVVGLVSGRRDWQVASMKPYASLNALKSSTAHVVYNCAIEPLQLGLRSSQRNAGTTTSTVESVERSCPLAPENSSATDSGSPRSASFLT